MFSTFLSVVGGGALRAIWGEVAALLQGWSERKQAALDHVHEIERMKLQGELDGAAFERNQAAIRLQAELGVQTIRVQADADLEKLAAGTFDAAVKGVNTPTGFKIIDAWKSAILPALATEVLVLITLYYQHQGWVLDAKGWELAGSVLGVFIADRMLFRRGK